jgi:hypothetical protein
MKLRIVQRTNVDSSITYIIQKRKLFKWADAKSELSHNVFKQHEKAKKAVKYFNGSSHSDEVVEVINVKTS